MGLVSRRQALAVGLSGCATLLEGCGGGGAPADERNVDPSEWVVGPLYFVPTFVTTFDLSPGLPPHVVRGGTFAVSPSGAALPDGMRLSSAGIVSLGSAVPGVVEGVVFSYSEP
jgi:hypothetical protein